MSLTVVWEETVSVHFPLYNLTMETSTAPRQFNSWIAVRSDINFLLQVFL